VPEHLSPGEDPIARQTRGKMVLLASSVKTSNREAEVGPCQDAWAHGPTHMVHVIRQVFRCTKLSALHVERGRRHQLTSILEQNSTIMFSFRQSTINRYTGFSPPMQRMLQMKRFHHDLSRCEARAEGREADVMPVMMDRNAKQSCRNC
jgi:hypothetical protein